MARVRAMCMRVPTVVLTNRAQGTPLSHFEIELMQAFTAEDGTIFWKPAQPDVTNSDQTVGGPVFSVFGKFRKDLCSSKGARQHIDDFDNVEETAGLLRRIGAIHEMENGT